MKRKSLILLFAAAVLGVGAVGAFVVPSLTRVSEARELEPATEETAPTPVSVAEARLGPVALHLTTTSAVEAERTAQVLSETSGVLTEINVREGDSVAAGQVAPPCASGSAALITAGQAAARSVGAAARPARALPRNLATAGSGDAGRRRYAGIAASTAAHAAPVAAGRAGPGRGAGCAAGTAAAAWHAAAASRAAAGHRTAAGQWVAAPAATACATAAGAAGAAARAAG